MRLLHSKTLELREFPTHEAIAYVMLSHTWGPDEVLFQDISGFNALTTPPTIKLKSGYQKVEACCAQAARDGFEWVWIDTCCIDKRSSAELSEAINSMYRWYQDCAVCYAYLADVPSAGDLQTRKRKFRESRWFTRGWTLQELIAPFTLEFYGEEWHSKGQDASLGTKQSLQTEISEVTKIPIDVLIPINVIFPRNALRDSGLYNYSIAQKMSWAAQRETTRIEDRAYCLMGLFNVNMPLLYGERERAFVRLQEEIMKVSNDETLFAWSGDSRGNHQGLLAMSPAYFAGSGGIVPIFRGENKAFAVTNMGLRMDVLLSHASDLAIVEARGLSDPLNELDTLYVAVLNCYDQNTESLIGVLLGCIFEGSDSKPGSFARVDDQGLIFIDQNTYHSSARKTTTIFVMLAETSDPSASQRYVRAQYLERAEQYQTVWLREAPADFRIVATWPKDSWTKNGDEMPKLKDEISQPNSFSTALLFEDEKEAFTVSFGSYLAKHWIQVRYRSPGDSLGDAYETENIESLVDGSDRVTHMLDSGRVVYARFRPQRAYERFGYALDISVDEKE
jgi:hypothetical protein